MGSVVPDQYLRLLRHLEMAQTLPDAVLLEAIARYGWTGMSWVDLQLVLSANAAGHALWTRDRASGRAAGELGIRVVAD